MLIQQRLKECDLAETELDEISGFRDANTLSEGIKTFAFLPCFSEHPSAGSRCHRDASVADERLGTWRNSRDRSGGAAWNRRRARIAPSSHEEAVIRSLDRQHRRQLSNGVSKQAGGQMAAS